MVAKQSAYLKKVMAQIEREQKENSGKILQMGMDVAVVALNRSFGFGPERLNRFREMYQTVWDEYADMISADGDDTEYAYAKMDEVLKQICGEYYTPREARYG